MKKFISDFFLRGLCACGFGPIVLAVLYLILQAHGVLYTLSVNEVCIGIVSLFLLAFIAGGMNAVYQIEQLPLMAAILIHSVVLYICYLVTYLLNNWLEKGIMPILVFSCIFVVGFIAIWAVIYCVTKNKTKRLNSMLKQKQQAEQ